VWRIDLIKIMNSLFIHSLIHLDLKFSHESSVVIKSQYPEPVHNIEHRCRKYTANNQPYSLLHCSSKAG
jgi:hypothetical protein